MNEQYTIHFDGAVTAITPLTTSPPLPGRTRDSALPSLLPRMLVDYAGQRSTVPYMPGAGIRGTLRRRAIDVIMPAFSDGLTLDDFYYLAIGGVKGGEAEDKAAFLEAAERRRKNPLIALFGSGAPWSQGRLSVSHAVPIEPITASTITGVRTDDFTRAGGKLDILEPEEQRRWLDMALHNTERSRKEGLAKRLSDKIAPHGRKASGLSAAEAEEVNAQIETLKIEIDRHAALAYSSNSILIRLAGYEIIPQGTKLAQKLTLTNVSTNEIGLFLSMLQIFALNPVLGAKTAHHCGTVDGLWNYSVRKSDCATIGWRGEISFQAFNDLEFQDDLFAESISAFGERLNAGEFDFRAPRRSTMKEKMSTGTDEANQ